MKRTLFLLLGLLAASSAFAQAERFEPDPPELPKGPVIIDEPDLRLPVEAGLIDDIPFKLSWKLDRSAAKPGGDVRIAIVFEIGPHHKIYRDQVKVDIPSSPGVASAKLLHLPEGKLVDDPGIPEDTRVFTGGEAAFLLATLANDASGSVTLKAAVTYVGCSETQCFPPKTDTLSVGIPVAAANEAVEFINRELFKGIPDKIEAPVVPAPKRAAAPKEEEGEFDFARLVREKGLIVALPAALLWGLLTSLTPCVYPLIPIVLAVVGAGAAGVGWKRGLGLSLVYVAGMSVTYAALGGVAGAIGDVTQTVATNPWVVGFVCAVFVALALSMFGLYDISVPSSISTRLQKKRGGLLGILVMGILSGLVAGPCVSAPLLGLMVGVAKQGSVPLGALAGGCFGLGMGAILLIAGTSSKALQALPRSGGWMVSVKRFFGWVLLAAAIYFAQPLIGYALYQALLGALLVTGSFFMGILDRTGPDTSWTARVRQGIGVLVLIVGLLYFVAGAAPLLGFQNVFTGGEKEPIAWVTNLDGGLKQARDQKRPALVDVWADWCTYCREMDRTVFVDPDVVAESRRFVMIKVDASHNVDEVKKRLGTAGPPSFLFVPTEGDNLTVSGPQTTDRMLKLMRETR